MQRGRARFLVLGREPVGAAPCSHAPPNPFPVPRPEHTSASAAVEAAAPWSFPPLPAHHVAGLALLRATQTMSPQLRCAFSTSTPWRRSSDRWRSSASVGWDDAENGFDWI
jgi:hypothetical protein